MEFQEIFKEAIVKSKTLNSKPDNETLLKLYSLYKQATEGDNTAEAPINPFDFAAKAKYISWMGLKGTSANDAMQQYINLVNELKGS